MLRDKRGDNGSAVELGHQWDQSPPTPRRKPSGERAAPGPAGMPLAGALTGLPGSGSKVHPERGIFAELRRSSEIFKSILLNLSMRDAEAAAGPGMESPSNATPPETPQVDLAGLLAAHERRRLAAYRHMDDSSASSSLTSSSSSLSCRSSSDDECEGLAGGTSGLGHGYYGLGHGLANDVVLQTNPAISTERLGALSDYTRQHLFSLPVLFLAVARGSATLVYLLLKYGANVDFQ
ncbi:hypothetical protein FOCC_FOCC017627, partial [Frankliniella occidentalis]